MTIEWLLLLLPIAVVSGWISAVRWTKKRSNNNQCQLSRQYIVGLNYLLNEQADKAIDTFIQLLEVDSETVETHLTLGGLFRRRGEVDRALRLHQNIIARPALSGKLRRLAMFELGLDYLSAGVLDRAEHIFDDLKDDPRHRIGSLQQLLHIYQATKDWHKAIIIAKQLQKLSVEDLRIAGAHFYCELAEQALDSGSCSNARDFLKKAQRVDKSSIRASLLQAKIAIIEKQWKDAIGYYKKAMLQDIHFFSEALAGFKTCFTALNDQTGFQKLLLDATKKGAGTTAMLAAAKSIAEQKGDKFAAEYIHKQLQDAPSMRGLKLN